MDRRSDLHKACLHPAVFIEEICIAADCQPARLFFAGIRVHVIFCIAVDEPPCDRFIVPVIILSVPVADEPSVPHIGILSLRCREIIIPIRALIDVLCRGPVEVLRQNTSELFRIIRIIQVNGIRRVVPLQFLSDHVVINAVCNISVISDTRNIADLLRALCRPVRPGACRRIPGRRILTVIVIIVHGIDRIQKCPRITTVSSVVAELADLCSHIHSCPEYIIFRIRFDVARVQIARIAAGKLRHQGIIVDIVRVMTSVLIIRAPEDLRGNITHGKDRILCELNDLNAFGYCSVENVFTVTPVILHIAVRTGHISVVGKIQLIHLILIVIENVDHISHMVVMIMADVYIKVHILLIAQP